MDYFWVPQALCCSQPIRSHRGKLEECESRGPNMGYEIGAFQSLRVYLFLFMLQFIKIKI